MTDTEKVNMLFDKHKDNFMGQFHSVLWKLIVEKIRKGSNSALTSNYTGHSAALGIADMNQNGYTPTGCYFKDDMRHDKIEEICDDLNKVIFNLEPVEASEIVLTSMRR